MVVYREQQWVEGCNGFLLNGLWRDLPIEVGLYGVLNR